MDDNGCDHCGMPITGGYAVVHRDGREARVHIYTADCLAALKGRIEVLEAENGLLRAEIAAHPFMTRITSGSAAGVTWPDTIGGDLDRMLAETWDNEADAEYDRL